MQADIYQHSIKLCFQLIQGRVKTTVSIPCSPWFKSSFIGKNKQHHLFHIQTNFLKLKFKNKHNLKHAALRDVCIIEHGWQDTPLTVSSSHAMHVNYLTAHVNYQTRNHFYVPTHNRDKCNERTFPCTLSITKHFNHF